MLIMNVLHVIIKRSLEGARERENCCTLHQFSLTDSIDINELKT